MRNEFEQSSTLAEIEATTLSNGRQRKVFVGTTNAIGTASLNALLTEGFSYPYAISLHVFENFGNSNKPSGVAGAVFVVENLIIAPLDIKNGIVQTTVTCVLQARQRSPIQGDIHSHAPWQGAIPVCVILEYDLG